MAGQTKTWEWYRHVLAICGIWLIMWTLYVFNNYLSTTIITHLSSFWAHVYRNTAAMVLYGFTGYEFMRSYYFVENKLKPWQVGLIWMILSMIADFFFWKSLYNLSFSYMLKPYYFWKGSLYPLQLVVLFLSPIFGHRRHKKQHYLQLKKENKRHQRLNRPQIKDSYEDLLKHIEQQKNNSNSKPEEKAMAGIQYRVYPDVQVQHDFNDHAVVYDPEKSVAFSMNEIGSLIWKALEEKGTIEHCVEVLQEKYEDAPDNLDVIVTNYVDTLIQRGLVGRVDTF